MSSSQNDRCTLPHQPIAAVIADIDGTLVDSHKQLTPRAIRAVAALDAAGIAFSLASSRPPVGFGPLVQALGLRAPLAAFNGGTLVQPNLRTVLRSCPMPAQQAQRALDMLAQRGIDAWLFSRGEWCLTRPDGPYIDLERRTIGAEPRVLSRFDDLSSVDKLVGVSADFEALARAEHEMQDALSPHLTVARSQQYYLDITDPAANKGEAVRGLSQALGIATARIAVLGDMRNDVPMFKAAGFAIAMGQAEPFVREAAHCVTASNDDEGFAKAIEQWILPNAAPRNSD